MTDTVEIIVNGEKRRIEPNTTISNLLIELGLPQTGIAVAVNMNVIPRSQHGDFPLTHQSRVEIIRAVGGG